MEVKFPAYQIIINELLEELSFGKFAVGDSFYTEDALISRFSVAKMTVREAMRRLVENGFIKRQRGSGSYVANLPDKPCRIKVTRHCVIGILTGRRMFETNIPLSKMLVNLHDQALKRGIMLYLGGDDVASLIESQVDGIIVSGELSPNNIKVLKNSGIPAVAVNKSYKGILPIITTDMRKVGYNVYQYLHDHGYRRMTMVGLGKDAEMVRNSVLPGIEDAMLKLNTAKSCMNDLVGKNVLADLESALDKGDIPDVLLLMNWWAIYPTLQLLDKKKLKIPEDIAILVHGEKAVELNTPVPLSIIRHNYNQAAKIAMDMLMKMICGKNVEDIFFDSSIVERGSCPGKNIIRETNSSQ